MRTKTISTFLMVMMFGMGGIISAQIDPTSQQQTITPVATVTVQAQQTAVVEKVISNADWTPIEQVFDGVTMVLVPAGCFEMGMDAETIQAFKEDYSQVSDEFFNSLGPAHQICIDAPFWLDKTEVTQAQFLANGGVKANPNAVVGDNRPVERITWFEALAYCESRGGRLPTEAEWEYAARGPDGLIYPWGDDFIADNAVYGEDFDDQIAEVGSRPAGASWVGAYDMAGNVWEWMNSMYRDYPYDLADGREDVAIPESRVLRGGSRGNSVVFGLRGADRNLETPSLSYYNFGVRCARSF